MGQGVATLDNPYLAFFRALPPSFRRDPSQPVSAVELAMPDWLRLKTAIAAHFSWAVPTDAAIQAIGDHATRVIEIGCGSGYWAGLMRQAGLAVTAVDMLFPAFAWHPVVIGSEAEAAEHPDKALFLCWPPFADPMAARALAAYAGTYVIYVGEWLGGSAELKFFTRLARDFDAVAAVAIPQWYMRDDRLIVFRRRPAGV